MALSPEVAHNDNVSPYECPLKDFSFMGAGLKFQNSAGAGMIFYPNLGFYYGKAWVRG
jgi:hypothetical protein